MELYVPYVVCSGALLYGFNYVYNLNSNKLDKKEVIDDTYDIIENENDIDSKKKIISYNSDKIEGNYNEKREKILKICSEQCNFRIKLNNNKSKNRQKITRFINEYNTIGYKAFIKKYNKKNI